MFSALVILLLLLIIYMGATRMGRAQVKKKRALEIQIGALSAQKAKLDALIIQAEEDLALTLEDNRDKAREEFRRATQARDEEIGRIKEQKLEEVEREAAEDKAAAVKKLDQWVDQEKARLQERLDEEYERKLEELKKLK